MPIGMPMIRAASVYGLIRRGFIFDGKFFKLTVGKEFVVFIARQVVVLEVIASEMDVESPDFP